MVHSIKRWGQVKIKGLPKIKKQRKQKIGGSGRVRGFRTTIYNNEKYHSSFEAHYAQELDFRLKAGEIIRWERQVKISLDVFEKHVCNYFLDFVVYYPDGSKEFLEVKGWETPEWKLKWKLFEAIMNHNEPMSKLTIVKK